MSTEVLTITSPSPRPSAWRPHTGRNLSRAVQAVHYSSIEHTPSRIIRVLLQWRNDGNALAKCHGVRDPL
jgi:hypothetical protein